jgi:hypothetical protein
MTDISKCSGEGCEQKEKCYRFTTIADEQWQSYFTEPPIKDGKCEYFWTNNNYKLNNEKHTYITKVGIVFVLFY